jgi:hypothetical protein
MKRAMFFLGVAIGTLGLTSLAFSKEGITVCNLVVHNITAINGKCFVKISAGKYAWDLHAEALSAYKYHQAHKSQESLPLSEQHCKGPWINISKENGKNSYTAYWGEACHGGETVDVIAISGNHYRGTNYEFELFFQPLR